MSEITSTRSKTLDIVKGITILLVIVGHCIQFGSGRNFFNKQLFYENIPFKVIYSFHMPLFMLVSGYLFFFSIRKYSTNLLLKSRVTKLLIPILLWNAMSFTVTKYTNPNVVGMSLFYEYAKISLSELWFLWAIFWNSLVVIIVNRFFKDSIILYICGFLLTFMIPDVLNLSLYKYMYPFFVIGYFFSKEKELVNVQLKRVKPELLLIMVGVIYSILILFFNYNTFIYNSGYSLIKKDVFNQLGIDMYRLLIGLVGSAFIILFVEYCLRGRSMSNRFMLSNLGVNSLGIYIISGYMFNVCLHFRVGFSLNYAITLTEVFVVIAISYYATNILKRFNLTNNLLLGGR
jgi:fucose 4-O-acetylase-like acetyltransferase